MIFLVLFMMGGYIHAQKSETVLESICIERDHLGDSIIIGASKPLAPVIIPHAPYAQKKLELIRIFVPQVTIDQSFHKKLAGLKTQLAEYRFSLRKTEKPLSGVMIELSPDQLKHTCTIKPYYAQKSHAFCCQLMKMDTAKKIKNHVVNKRIA